LPREKTAYKELRKAKRRHFRNISAKTELKTFAKKFEKLVASKKSDEAGKMIKTLMSKLNKAAAKGIIHKNTASRKISRLMKRLASSKA